MRLAVFSDIHGNITAFDAVLADLEAQGSVDHIWFLGDLVAVGPRPVECIQRLKTFVEAREGDETLKGTFHAISGNNDRYLVRNARHDQSPPEDEEKFLAMRKDIISIEEAHIWTLSRLSFEDYTYLAKLGWETALQVPNYGRVIGYHGVPGNDEGYLRPDTEEEEACDMLLDREGRLGIGGHIHVQMDRTLRTGWRVINVGSVGMSAEMPGKAQYGIFTFTGDHVEVDLRAVPYDIESVIQDYDQVGFPKPEWAEKSLRGN